MTTPTVIELTEKSLISGGYDGLYNEDMCGCKIGDLAPCGDIQGGCRAGYLAACPGEGKCEIAGWAFHIEPEKPTEGQRVRITQGIFKGEAGTWQLREKYPREWISLDLGGNLTFRPEDFELIDEEKD